MSVWFTRLLVAALWWLPLPAGALLHHALQVSIDPAAHSIEVQDSISLPEGASPRVEFRLHPALAPQLVDGKARLLKLEQGAPDAGDDGRGGVAASRYRLELAPGQRRFTLRYSGRILHALRQQGEEYARAFSETPGMIAQEGVFLSASSVWYPQFDDALLSFELQLRLPPGWSAMTQGERLEAASAPDGRREHWRCDAPQEEIYLVAGRYTQYRQAGDAVEALVLLREPDAALAQQYLDATETYVALYNGLIGPYPYQKFALVENFWETGYGMPSFTLLGPRVIRFPFILHSSYPHEILHNWWGNGVYVDYDSGNWAEGLTSYLADHLVKEQRGEAVEYRRTVLQKYTDYVRTEKDFPLTAFRSRHSASSEAVGYGKTLMLFHMLRRQLGDARFTAALRELYRRHRFEVADFGDVERVFSEAAQHPLDDFFAQWVRRAGAPALRVSDARLTRRGGRHVLSASLEQTQPGPAYMLRVPVAVALQGEEVAWQGEVELESRARRIEIELPAPPLELVVDPQFDLFRRLHRAEIPPSVSQAMGAERVLIVLPAQAAPRLGGAYRRLAESWQAGDPQRVSIAVDADLDTLPQDRAVWLFGWNNRFRPALERALEGDLLAGGPDTLRVAGEDLERTRHAVVLMARQPSNPDQALGWLASEEAQSLPGLGRKLPHYGRYSYLAFTGTEPDNVLKGQWPVRASPMRVRLQTPRGESAAGAPLQLAPRQPLAPAPERFSRVRLRRGVELLAGEAMAGRGLGSAELDRAADYIAAEFRAAGLQPGGDGDDWFQVWEQRIEELGKPIRLRNVIGVLPGSDPRLAGERVVIGAHYDHFGRGAYAEHAEARGRVHPGADDNASGVAVMLELARVLGRQPLPRTVVFAAFTAEETGRLGSRRYVEQARGRPAEAIIAMLNLDTIGRLGDKPLTVFGSGSAAEWPHIFSGAAHVAGLAVKPVADDFGSSDQSSFIAAGIPAVQLFAGVHQDLHRPEDTPDKIDHDGLLKVTALVYETMSYLAARPAPLTSQLAGAPGPASAPAAKRRVSLGTVPDFAYAGAGVRLDEVRADSPAAQAGLQAGDVLIAIDDVPVSSVRDYAAALGRLAPGDEVRLRFRRAGVERAARARSAPR